MKLWKIVIAPLLVSLLLSGCCPREDSVSSVTPHQARAALSSAPGIEDARSRGGAAENVEITFTVILDGASQRIEWRSSEPAGPEYRICFEKNGRIVLCGDVQAGTREGVMYAFRDVAFAGAKAVFRLRR